MYNKEYGLTTQEMAKIIAMEEKEIKTLKKKIVQLTLEIKQLKRQMTIPSDN